MTNTGFFIAMLVATLGAGFAVFGFSLWVVETRRRKIDRKEEEETAKKKKKEIEEKISELERKQSALVEYLQLKFKDKLGTGWFGWIVKVGYEAIPKNVCSECGQKKPMIVAEKIEAGTIEVNKYKGAKKKPSKENETFTGGGLGQ